MQTLNKPANLYQNHNSNLPSVQIKGYKVFTGNLEQLSLSEKTIINTINQNAYCVAEWDDLFKESLEHSDILLPDGIGVLLAAKFLLGERIHKIAGYDLHKFLLKKLNETHGSCFYLGSSEATLKIIKARANREYPNVKVGSFSPPYKPVFSEEDNKIMIQEVNNFKPDVLFIGMTAPKQENWVHVHKNQLDANIICSIGAAFDFYAETIKRPSEAWRKLGLEWFARLIREPKRMSRRYLYNGPIFLYMLLKLKFKALFNKSVLQTA